MECRISFPTGIALGIAMGALLATRWGAFAGHIDAPESGAGTPPSELAWLPADPAASLERIEAQFRGMDVTMWEIGYRFGELYFAGLDENWDYADYHIEKIAHALQLGLERRPARTESAGPFLDEVLPAVGALVAERQGDAFLRGMERLRTGCMQCHVAEEAPFFTVAFPVHRAAPIAPLGDGAAIDW